MDIKVPLKMLKFGHEDGEGINARVAGRDDGIAALAANLNANGQIENLVVKDAGDGFFSVANGNRRLAAFRMMYGEGADQPIGCTLHQVDNAKAFEYSLATAITAEQLHPVDQYEAFAKLKERGQTEEEIAQHYGLTVKYIRQRLAMGSLSPLVRQAWRSGEFDEGAAQAFTLAADHAQQEKVLEKLRKDIAEQNFGDGKIDADEVEGELRVDPNNIGYLLRFVGTDSYEAKNGKIITRDLFGHRHKVSDEKLLKKLADDKLEVACKWLKSEGWSFATIGRPNNSWDYGTTKIEPTPTAGEEARIEQLEKIIGGDNSLMISEMTADQVQACTELQAIQQAILDRAYTAEMRAKSGCWVDIDHNGELKVEYGKIKPKEKAAAAVVERTERKKAAASQTAAEGKPAPESKVVSNALRQRLEAQLITATRDAIAGDPLLAESPLAEVMAKTICSMITPDRAYSMPDGVRTKLPTIRQVLDENVFNAAMAKRFDPKDYFSSAPKPLVLKAISEAINPDEARRLASKTKADIWKWALDNLAKTGWLPKELRTVHYKGPGSDGYKKPVPAAAAKPEAAKPATTRDAVKKAKSEREARKATIAQKRIAKKPAKKK
ncbi:MULTISPECIES: transcriptional regulator [unclassified Bradyrhizobium]|uniref:ParB/RepB/Spo0J family partition protein n=1 Tax=unclassified Bradyrhizobium TaxID=2631580 RepID=UPI001FF87F6C|nr:MULTISPECIES: transcriptional regulator [unclassified Bradyrhizobium]MCK1536851.1 transcriptional regulator [Bradyrhizobium sp. 176]MCK1560154.1 transcriptional regulator [Bradyrhizobium sp. 171]